MSRVQLAGDQKAPHLNERAVGWLRHLHRKATTPDDWSEDGKPHEWWDAYSTEPMLSFPRFDLSESSYALGIMADQTPAWREVYADILDGLAERHITFWAAVDWLTQFGPDPRRKSYPPEWLAMLIPEHLAGDYDVPGWVANGIEPWGLQPDPIGADGNLFFKGWLNLVQSMHAYVTGEDKWGEPFEVAGVDRARFEWTQHRLVEHLSGQWRANPLGPHCENTKIWPFCLSAAGLGLQLYDAVFERQAHGVFGDWLEHNKDRYFGVAADGSLEWCAMYHDPLQDHTHLTFPPMGLALSLYIMPQNPVFAEFLYRGAVRFMGWDDASKPIVALSDDPRMLAVGLVVSREFGDYATEKRLRDYAERNFEPRWFGDGEFGFWFGFGESWPRGQLSALAMMSEVGPSGSWRKLFTEPNLGKFDEPRVEGVDYPTLGVNQAFNDLGRGVLRLSVFAGDAGRKGEQTSFVVTALPSSEGVRVLRDGAQYDQWRATTADSIEITTTVGAHSFEVVTGYKAQKARKRQPAVRGRKVAGAASASSARSVSFASGGVFAAVPSVCSCCIPGVG